MDRRNFIKLTAVTGGAATLASCGNPEHQLIRFVPDEDLTPGIAEIKNGVCPLCRAGCGTTVRVMQGDVDVVRNGQAGVVTMSLAKKLEGNPTHPVNQGALCARGQAGIQVTYHPDRITQPLKRRGAKGSGDFQPISWDDAVAELVGQLDTLAASAGQGSLAYWTRPGANARHDLAGLFLARYGAPPATTFELFSDDVLRRANRMSFGREQLPTFDLAAARYAISFGADFLGTWNSPVSHTAAFGRMRQGRPGIRGAFVQVEPRMSLTGASADEWVPIRPGTEGVLALGLAHVILRDKLRPGDAGGRAGGLVDGWSRGLADHTPEAVEQKTGVKAARVERLARELAEQRPSVAIIGGAALAQANGLFQALAVNALNALLGSVDAPGGMSFMPQGDSAGAAASRPMRTVAADILAADRSPVQLLLVDNVNPVFATPPGWRVRDAVLKVPFVVSFGSFIDDTSALADLILPDHSALESWNDARPESGAGVAVVTVAGPAMKPLHQSRATPDVLLDVARKLKQPIKPELPWPTFDQMLQSTMGEEDWATATKQGWVELKRAEGQGQRAEGRAPGKVEGRAGGTPARAAGNAQAAPPPRDAVFDGDPAQYPFHFLPYASQALVDGSVAHLPWLQEMPDPITTAMWSNWVEINPQTAARLGIGDGDIVEIASDHGSVRAPAVVSPGIAPDVIAMPVGQGHETFTRYASGRGSNPVKVLAPAVEPETGALAWAATRVKVSRVAEPDGRLIRFAGALFDHPNARR
jgi:anaerobic selenocysteine-containing dehydrogenase